ncbi:MAG: MFS transporter [Pseudomonadota bacterium]
MIKNMLSCLAAQPPAPIITDQAKIKKEYKKWRFQILTSMMFGYAMFYFCRKNFSMAMPYFLSELGYTKTDLGLILTLFSIVYGVSKFCSGMLSDRSNARYFMALGLILSAFMNIAFGLSSSMIFFGVFWIANAWFQGMGWPPCARLLTHWFSPTELGTKWGIWNASHQVGGAGILILAGWLIPHYGWRSAFFVPAAIAVVSAIFLMVMLRDTPQSMGLPPVEKHRGDAKCDDHECDDNAASFKEIFFQYIIKNRLLWIICFANIFVYIVRIGVLDWAPTFLVEAKGASLMNAGIITAISEVVGIAGAIGAGWFSDTLFKGRRGPVNVIFMILVIAAIFGLWKVPVGSQVLATIYLVAVKFLIYGPQMLVGVAAADFASKRAAATATGLTGTFGYVGSAICGVGTGLVVDKWGWDGGFIFFIAAAVIGTFLFLFTWKARAASLEAHHNSKK